MIYGESRLMVPDTGMEATVRLKDTSRPNTLPGAILHSFAMYKNFPVAAVLMYSRLASTGRNTYTRIGFGAGMIAGATMVGALATQMSELAKGNDPIPMNTGKFWGKAILKGGGLSIMGDFLFGHINQFGRSPAETVAGPITQFAGDVTQLAFGDVFALADTVGTLKPDPQMKFPGKAAEFLRRYSGTSVWWANMALNRQVFDRLDELVDPRVYAKRQRRMTQRMRDYGSGSYWAPGQRTPSRGPDFSRVFGQ
jgi:hypothetical protein